MNVNVRYRLGWFQKIRDFLWFFDDSLDLERQQRLNNFRLRPTFNINFSKWFFFSSTLIVYTVRAVHEFNHNLQCTQYVWNSFLYIFFDISYNFRFPVWHPTTYVNCIFYYDPERNSTTWQQQRRKNGKYEGIPTPNNHNNNNNSRRRRRKEAKTKCMFTLFQKVLLLHSFYWTFCSHRRQFSHFIAFSFLKYAI